MRLRAIGEPRVRMRTAAAVLGLLCAVSGLSACRTNVGTAANIDGHRLSENDLNDYITEAAKPLKSSDGSQSIAPKPFVVEILIDRRLYPKILGAAGAAAPSAGQLTTLRRQYLGGASAKTAVEKLGVVGYSAKMDTTIIDVQIMSTLLNQAQNEGKDLSAVVAKLTFPVSVNPRYGTWDSKTLRFSADVTSGLPGFLTLQTPATQS